MKLTVEGVLGSLGKNFLKKKYGVPERPLSVLLTLMVYEDTEIASQVKQSIRTFQVLYIEEL